MLFHNSVIFGYILSSHAFIMNAKYFIKNSKTNPSIFNKNQVENIFSLPGIKEQKSAIGNNEISKTLFDFD